MSLPWRVGAVLALLGSLNAATAAPPDMGFYRVAITRDGAPPVMLACVAELLCEGPVALRTTGGDRPATVTVLLRRGHAFIKLLADGQTLSVDPDGYATVVLDAGGVGRARLRVTEKTPRRLDDMATPVPVIATIDVVVMLER
jgi:hypothetical protein